MGSLLFGFLANFILLTLIGLGPASCLFRPRGSFAVALAVAPAAGITLTTIVGSWLVMCDLPVAVWTWPWVGAGLTASALLLLTGRKGLVLQAADGPSWRNVTGLFVVTATVLILPQLVGGHSYSILRGNGSDTVNYVASAGLMDMEPYSAVRRDAQELVDQHQSYMRAASLVRETRWATFMLLAFTSRVAQVPIYQFDYCFTLLFFLSASGAAYVLARRLAPGDRWAALCALAVCGGFWAQYVQDNRAMSHINSIPLLLFIAFLLAFIEEQDSPRIAWRENLALGLGGATLFCLYPEVFPMFALGTAFFWGARLAAGQFIFCRARGYLVSAAAMVLALLPSLGMLGRFLMRQLDGAASTKTPEMWVRAGLNWLYSDPWLGVWGLAPFTTEATVAGAAAGMFHLGFRVVGGLLTLLLVMLAVHYVKNYRNRQAPYPLLLASLTFAGAIQMMFLLLREQYWPAGKAFSFVYPFLVLAVAGFGVSLSGGRQKWFFLGVRYLVIGWLLIQGGLGLYRVRLAATGTEFANYLWHHGEYRQHDLDLSVFSAALAVEPPRPVIWTYIPNATVSEYVAFAFGWNARMTSLLPTVDSVSPGVPAQRIVGEPSFLVVEKNFVTQGAFRPERVVAENSELLLVRLQPESAMVPILVDFVGGHPATRTDGSLRLAVDNRPAVLKIVSPKAGRVLLRAGFHPPRVAGDGYQAVAVGSGAEPFTRVLAVSTTTEGIDFQVKPGVNEITLRVFEELQAAVLTQPLEITDPRPVFVSEDSIVSQALASTVLADVANLGAMGWYPSTASERGEQQAALVEDNGKTRLEVASTDNADICLIAPMKLPPGLYRISIVVSGEAQGLPEGAGHFSIHGQTKVISIPAGSYRSQVFFDYLKVSSQGLDAEISFGLGGWSLGRGWLSLEKLMIEKMH